MSQAAHTPTPEKAIANWLRAGIPHSDKIAVAAVAGLEAAGFKIVRRDAHSALVEALRGGNADKDNAELLEYIATQFIPTGPQFEEIKRACRERAAMIRAALARAEGKQTDTSK